MTTQTKKKPTAKRMTPPKKSTARKRKASSRKKGPFARLRRRIDNFLRRRPHRSFRLTHRRDYKRSLALPGFWSFSVLVVRTLYQDKKLFIPLALIYAVISMVVVGIASQESFVTLQNSITEAGQEAYEGNWGALGTAAALALSTLAGRVAPNITEVQQIYAVLMGLLVWLTTVWILRQRMAGHTLRLRDALYSAGSPIVATFLVAIVMILQLIPIIVAIIGYVTARSTGLLDSGIEAMLFWVVAGGLATLSLYWLTTGALALVVITLPGMYPMRALQIAGDMVIGRRLRILLRMVWMLLLLSLFWLIVLIPVILVDMGVKQLIPALQWVPVVPLVVAGLTTVSVIWMSSYMYILYRKIVDDDADPA
jgi:hypothetical protein